MTKDTHPVDNTNGSPTNPEPTATALPRDQAAGKPGQSTEPSGPPKLTPTKPATPPNPSDPVRRITSSQPRFGTTLRDPHTTNHNSTPQHELAVAPPNSRRRFLTLAGGISGAGVMSGWALSRLIGRSDRDRLVETPAASQRSTALVAPQTNAAPTTTSLRPTTTTQPRSSLPLAGHTDLVMFAAWSPDGSRLATASWDGTARIWDTTGQTIDALEGHADNVWCVAWSADGSRLATTSGDLTVRIWDAATAETLHVLRGHTGPVASVTRPPIVPWLSHRVVTPQ